MFLEKTVSIKGLILSIQKVQPFENKETGKVSEPSVKLFFNSENNGKIDIFTVKIKGVDLEDESYDKLINQTVKIDNIQESGFGNQIYYSCVKEDIKPLK